MITNKEQQIKNSFIYMLPIIVSGILPLITLPIFTRILSKEDFGVLALANLYAIFANGLANLGMTEAYRRNYFQYRNSRLKTAQLLYSALLFVTVNFLIIAVLTFSFKGALSKLIIGSVEHRDILFWAFCSQFFTSISYYYMTYFKNSETAKSFVVYTITGSILYFVISLFLVAYLRIGVIGLIYAQLCSGVIIFSILNYKFITNLKPSLSRKMLIESLKISYPLTPRIFLGVIGSQFDKYMIGLLGSMGGVGIYSIGQRVASTIFEYLKAIHNVYQPQVFRRMFDLGEKGGESVGRYLTPFVCAYISGALMMSLFSEELITVLTPSSYHGAIDIVIIIAMYYGFLFFGTHPQLLYAKKTGITSILSIGRISLNIALNIPFIMKWGAIGAAWATLLAALISESISFAVSQHYYEIKWEYKKIASIYALFFASSLLMIMLRYFSVHYEYRLIFKSVSLATYVYLGAKLKVFTVENYLLIKDIITFKRIATSDPA